MVILRATSILEGQKEDKWMICSITHKYDNNETENVRGEHGGGRWEVGVDDGGDG